jgi:hypothetical protein
MLAEWKDDMGTARAESAGSMVLAFNTQPAHN